LSSLAIFETRGDAREAVKDLLHIHGNVVESFRVAAVVLAPRSAFRRVEDHLNLEEGGPKHRLVRVKIFDRIFGQAIEVSQHSNDIFAAFHEPKMV
jgi:hypothetical protein